MVIDYGEFNGMGHFGAGLQCGTETSSSKFELAIAWEFWGKVI